MVRQKIWKNLCKRKDTFKEENAQVCSMHFNEGSYKWDLEHELLHLTPRKRLKTDAVPILPLSTSTVPKPEDQCDKKFPKNLHESTFSQTLSSVDNQGKDQVDFILPRSRREMRRQNKQIVTFIDKGTGATE
uniref:Putative LOC100575238 [Acyrthosiphon pisum] n=1 Tax=Lepeophtheirus salmonis TaxID=72036 RepID=A0A0K2T387_LEPSM